MKKSKKIFRLSIKEEYFNAVPRPSKEEYESLKNSIRLDGQKDPIVVNSTGVILDGHSRFEILKELQKKVEYRVKDFKTIEDERFYVIECNLNRRHLTPFQKVELSMMLYEDIKKQMAERMAKYARTGDPEGKNLHWRKIFASKIGVGENQCAQAVAIIKRRDLNLITRLRNGSITIANAYLQLEKRKANKQTSKHIMLECPHCKNVTARNKFVRIK